MTSEKYWDDRATKRLTEVEKQSNDYIKRVKQIYTRANRDIKKQIANIYKNYSKETGLDIHTLKTLLSKDESDKFWKTLEGKGLKKYVQDNYKARINRLEQLQGQLYARAKEIYGEELETVYGHYRGVINESYNKTIYDTQIGTGYDFSFNKLDDKTINAVLNSKWYGGNYSTRIWGNTNILADRLSKILGGALISGKPYYKTANEVAEIFGVAQYYAERLIRTETNHFNAEAEALAYEELGVEKYVFVATLDNRTSEKCQNHDGKIYNFKDRKKGENYPPLHPNCRSTTRGYLGEEEEKMLKRRAKNPITGETEIIDNVSYSEWKKKYITDDSNVISKNNLNNMGKYDKISNNIELNNSFKETLMNIYERNRKELNLNMTPLDKLKDNRISPFNVDFGNVDNEIAKKWAEQFETLSDKYYTTCTKVTQTKIYDGNIYRPDVINRTELNYMVSNSEILINNNLTNYDDFVSRVARMVDSGHAVKIAESDYAKYVATHEFAHTLTYINQSKYKSFVNADMKKIQKFNESVKDLYKEYKKELYELFEESRQLDIKFIMDTSNYTIEDTNRRKFLSKRMNSITISNYASENEEEFMAEAFTDYILGIDKSEYSLKVGKLIDEAFERKM